MGERILVDLLGFTGGRGGTETYAREITTRLPALLPDFTFIAVTNRAGAGRVRTFFPGDVRVRRWVGADRVTWALGELLTVNRTARRVGADVVWTPANFGPVTRSAKRVSTVHDVIYHAKGGPLIARTVRAITARLVSWTAHSAEVVITASESAKSAIVDIIGVDPGRIEVVPHGTTSPEVPADPWSTLERLGIHRGRPILLSTGNRLPHKNFDGLLRAVATIAPENRPLTIVTGSRGEDPLAPLVAELGLNGDVVLAGWISLEELESLYAVADVYACPSLDEGFGLPVIDAMRRGCVVLANDVPALREVGGDVAIYADAQSPQRFGAAIDAAIRDRPHERRRRAGLERSATFTWEESARNTARILSAVAGSTRSAA